MTKRDLPAIRCQPLSQLGDAKLLGNPYSLMAHGLRPAARTRQEIRSGRARLLRGHDPAAALVLDVVFEGGAITDHVVAAGSRKRVQGADAVATVAAGAHKTDELAHEVKVLFEPRLDHGVRIDWRRRREPLLLLLLRRRRRCRWRWRRLSDVRLRWSRCRSCRRRLRRRRHALLGGRIEREAA